MVLFASSKVYALIPVTVSGTAVTTPALAASYPDLASALNALNAITAYTTPGTIIFTCTAGSSETAPIKGYVIGSASLDPLLSAINTVTIIKASGTVTINAGVGTATPASASPDGMLYLNGADYITIDGLTFTDGNSASNTVAMEFGVGLFKRTVAAGGESGQATAAVSGANAARQRGGTLVVRGSPCRPAFALFLGFISGKARENTPWLVRKPGTEQRLGTLTHGRGDGRGLGS